MFPIFYSYLYKGVQLKHDFIWFLKRNAANIKSKNNKIDINTGNAGSRIQVPTEKWKKIILIVEMVAANMIYNYKIQYLWIFTNKLLYFRPCFHLTIFWNLIGFILKCCQPAIAEVERSLALFSLGCESLNCERHILGAYWFALHVIPTNLAIRITFSNTPIFFNRYSTRYVWKIGISLIMVG